MEDLFGFLIILVSIIFSIIGSVSKNKKKRTQPVAQSAPDQDADDNIYDHQKEEAQIDSYDMSVEEKLRQIEAKQYSDYERSKEEEQEQEQEYDPYEEDYDAEEEVREYQPLDHKEQEAEEPEENVKEQAGKVRKKRRSPAPRYPKDPLEEIQEAFDVEKGILYSEILNRKHF